MDKSNLIELTNKIYRTTLFFPKKEPLRYKIREMADDILANSVSLEIYNSPNPGAFAQKKEARKKDLIFNLENNLEVINSYFEIAKWQNWVNYFEVLEIQEKYAKLKSNLGERIKEMEAGESKGFEDVNRVQASIPTPAAEAVLPQIKKEIVIPEKMPDLEPRRSKIIRILKKVERIQVGEINKLFPEVSKRTIRRDFQKLLRQGVIERIGEKNDTYYKIKDDNQISDINRPETIVQAI